MRRILRNIILVFLSFFVANLGAQALEMSTSKWGVVKEQLDKLEPGDLLISDVMGVLYYQADRLISPMNSKLYKDFLDEIERTEGVKKRNLLEGTVKRSYTPKVVSYDLLDAFKKVIKNDVKLLFLTSGRTGSLGPIKELMELRSERIKQLGIEVSDMFPRKKMVFDQLPDLVDNRPAIFNRGILFTNRNDKGQALAAFLSEIKFRPNKVVFIDNQMRKIGSVARVCKNNNIEFIGIHFTRVYEMDSEMIEKDIVEKQLTYLKNKLIWLSDQQARCMIEQKDDLQFCRDI